MYNEPMTIPLTTDVLSTVPQGHKLTLAAKGSLSQYRENYGHRIAHWDVGCSPWGSMESATPHGVCR